jgi:hypothetical protein
VGENLWIYHKTDGLIGNIDSFIRVEMDEAHFRFPKPINQNLNQMSSGFIKYCEPLNRCGAVFGPKMIFQSWVSSCILGWF